MIIAKKRKGFVMNNLTKAIVSNSDMMKRYKACRDKAVIYKNIFVLKNNEPDAVLFSIAEYERLSAIIENIESLDANELAKITERLVKEENDNNG